MANVVESAVWETGIYQLETTDPVQGGVDGIDNLQAKQLANRTVFLKNSLAQTDADIAALQNSATSGARAVRAAQMIKYHLIDTAAVYVKLTASEAPIGSVAVLYLRLKNGSGNSHHQVSGGAVAIESGASTAGTAIQAMMLVQIDNAAMRSVYVSYHRWTNPGLSTDYCDISYGGYF